MNGVQKTKLPAVLGGPRAFDTPLHLTRPTLPSRRWLSRGLDRLYTTRMLSNQGPMARELEERLAQRVGTLHCALFCNATIAIMCLAKAMGMRGEVIIPSFTFAATAQALDWIGITPAFADIDRHSLTMSPSEIARLRSEKTSGVMPVNLFGHVCDHDAMSLHAKAAGIPLVYDSAQAFGSSYRGRPVGALAAAEVFSFHATKTFHTFEGGAVMTSDSSLHEELARMRNFGFLEYLDCVSPGLNGKMSEFGALVGLGLFDTIDEEIARRGELFAALDDAFKDVKGITRLRKPPGVVSNNAYYTLLVEPSLFGLSNLELNYALSAEQVASRCYFYPPVHQTKFHVGRAGGGRPPRLPHTEWAARRVICLPAHAGMKRDEIELLADTVMVCGTHASRIRSTIADKIPSSFKDLNTHVRDYHDPDDLIPRE